MGFGGSSPCAQVSSSLHLVRVKQVHPEHSKFRHIKPSHMIFTFTEPWCPEICRQAPQRGQQPISQSVYLLFGTKIFIQIDPLLTPVFPVPDGENFQPPGESKEGDVWLK